MFHHATKVKPKYQQSGHILLLTVHLAAVAQVGEQSPSDKKVSGSIPGPWSLHVNGIHEQDTEP